MNKIARRVSSAALTLSLVIASLTGLTVSAAAVDYAEPPSLTSLEMLSPSTIYEGEEFQAKWNAPVNTTGGVLVFRDFLGSQVTIDFARSAGTIAAGSGHGHWIPGPYTLDSVHVYSSYGRVTYSADGGVFKYPSGLRDPGPIGFDFASLNFTLEPLMNFSNSPDLSISGTPSIGQTLEAVFPPLEPAASNLEYAWMYEDALGEYIGHGPTYVVKPEDAGKKIVARVWASTRGYLPYERDSLPSEPVIGLFSSSELVTITGTTTVGQTLSAKLGTFNPAPESVSYAWKRNGEAIAEASAQQLLLTQADTSMEISVIVTAQRAGYETMVETSAPTARILNIFSYAGQPTISGTMEVGQILSVENASWSPLPDSVSYTWQRNGAVIAESSEPTYQLSAEDAGSTLTVRVTATKAGYETASTSSPPTPKIGAAPAPKSFIDVTNSTQFYTEISWLAAQGISTGWVEADGSRTYRPLSPVARDAMAAFLYRLAGKPDFTPPAVSPFADVNSSTQFYKEITWLAAKNISTGWLEPDGRKTFRPLEPVNRDAMAAFLYRFDNYPSFQAPTVSPFVDVSTDNIFYSEISWLASKGISTGFLVGSGCYAFDPVRPVARDAMAAFMYRFANGGTPPISGGGCTVNQPPAPAPSPLPTQPPAPPRPINPGDTKNCTSFTTWREAQNWFDYYYPHYGDVARLDNNNDGIACESLSGAPR